MRKSTGSAVSRPMTTTNAAASDKKHSFAKQDMVSNKLSAGAVKTDVNARKNATSRYSRGNKTSYDEFSAQAKLNPMTPSTTAGLPTTATQKPFHGKEFLGASKMTYGGPEVPMDSLMDRSQQSPELKNFNEPSHFGDSVMFDGESPTAKKSKRSPNKKANQKQQTARLSMPKGMIDQTVTSVFNEDSFGNSVGPGAYDAARSIDYTKPRHNSPDMSRHTERPVAGGKDTVSPDKYRPNKDVVLNSSPSWTMGGRPAAKAPDTDHSGPGAYDPLMSSTISGPKMVPPREQIEKRPKSSFVARGRAPTKSVKAPSKAGHRINKPSMVLPELETFAEPSRFGDKAKGMAFGAPKQSTSTNKRTRRSSGLASATSRRPAPESASGLTNLVFEEDQGPSQFEQEEMSKSRNAKIVKATKSGNVQQSPSPRKQLKTPVSKAKKQATKAPSEFSTSTYKKKQTVYRGPSATMGTLERPDINKNTAGTGALGPGAYATTNNFGNSVRGHSFGRPSPQRPSYDHRNYNVQDAERQTRYRSPSAVIDNDAARPATLAPSSQIGGVAPGQYRQSRNFGDDTKSFTISTNREQKIAKTAGPGQYDINRAEKLTKPSKQGGKMDKSPSRPKTFAPSGQVGTAGPGAYKTQKEFGQDTKRLALNREPRTKEIKKTAGPGSYNPDRAMGMTKSKSQGVIINPKSPARPSTFAGKQQIENQGPGRYDDGKGFDHGAKTFTIGEKREKPIADGPGAGAYDVERSTSVTKTRNRAAVFDKSASRPKSFALDGHGQAAPGTYDDGKGFDHGVKTFTIGQVREQPIKQGPGAGDYSPGRAEGFTKPKMPNVTMGGSPSRPSTFGRNDEYRAEPGSYAKGNEFGSNTKAFRIGEKRDKSIPKTAGPGEYNLDRAESQTKTKNRGALIGSSPERPDNFTRTRDYNAGPGAYDDGKGFDHGVKTFRIGEKREKPIPKTAGPGDYETDVAERQTKTKNRGALIGSSPERPDNFTRTQGYNMAPGAYDDGKRFDDGVKTFRIGEKRDKPIAKTAGPGDYNPDIAERQTKAQAPRYNLGSSPERPDNFTRSQGYNVAPGSYDDGKRFNDGVKPFRIGEKREKSIPKTAGPGDYDPDRAEAQTKTKNRGALIGSSPERPDNFTRKQDFNAPPGQYDDGKGFDHGVKTFTIGEKREKSIPKTAGPGEYDPDMAERQTKTRNRGALIGSSPTRPDNFTRPQDYNADPGAYDDGKRFNDSVKSFRIGEKREKPIPRTAGPGDYDPDVAESQTKIKNRGALIGSSPERPDNFTRKQDFNASPGQYDDGKRFGDDTKSFRIGEKREKPIPRTAGPGEYSPETAERQTKSQAPRYNLGSSPERPDNFTRTRDYNADPGAYDDGKGFDHGVKTFRIGEKREKPIPRTAGPGDYDPDVAESQTKIKNRGALIGSSPERPDNFTRKQDFNASPGQYDDGKRFGDDTKSFRIGEKREKPIPRTAGPGEYSPETAERQTKSQAPRYNLGSSPERPDNFTRTRDYNADPGAYDDGKGFDHGVKTFRIGEKREKPIPRTAGPGDYDPDVAESQTKIKNRGALIGSSPERPDNFTRKQDFNASPGQYDDGKRFGDDTKSFRIGEKREKPIPRTAGPGEYSPETAERQTKSQAPRYNLGSSPERPDNFTRTRDYNADPGAYDDGKGFDHGVKTFRIGEKREKPIPRTAGPGDYDPDVAESQTKIKNRGALIGSSPERPDNFTRKQDFNASPGQYDDGKRFGDDTKSFRIGEKREKPIPRTAGPGEYSPETAERQTKSQAPRYNLGSSPERPDNFTRTRDYNADPGAYDDGKGFDHGVKTFRIGEKREKPIPRTAGPGDYDPDVAESQTKIKNRGALIGSSPERPDNFTRKQDFNASPGQYDDGKRFGDDTKSFRIGEKKEKPIPRTAGPGEYSPETAERQTKSQAPRYNLGSSPERPDNFTRTRDYNADPGAYDDGKGFDHGVKTFRIGEKREKPIPRTAGPGDYDPDVAESQTKIKNRGALIGSSPERPDNFTRTQDYNAGPGAYNDGKKFGDNTKSFIIGEKRDKPIPRTAGPGEYSPEGAERQTKSQAPRYNLASSPERPDNFTRNQDFNASPGQYDDGKRFGDDTKSFKIGEKRERQIPKTAGPGEYDPDMAERQTKTRNRGALIGSSPTRPDNFTRPQDYNADPGAYDDGKRFNDGVKSFRIGEKREKPIPRTAGPGEYSPETAERQTKGQAPRYNLASSPERPDNFTRTRDYNADPGAYDDGKRFGDDTKSFKIGEKRDKPIPKTAGPGDYDPDVAERQTKSQAPRYNLGSSPERPDNFTRTQDYNADPGAYDDGKKFGDNTQSFKIGEKRDKPIPRSAGPGEYSPEGAERQTKSQAPRYNLASSPERPDNFTRKQDFNASPGQYDDGRQFGDDTKSFRIGEKRERQIPKTAGPGEYEPEKAESLTKTKAPHIDLGSSPTRPDNFTRTNDYNADPGAYDDGKRFGDDTKSFKIGEKRDKPIPRTAGPGDYDPDVAERQTKSQAPRYNLGSSPERPDNFTRTQDYSADPGAYDDGKKFGDNTQSFKIGEKRDTGIRKTAGPGDYEPERAENLTKTKAPRIDLGSSPKRPDNFTKTNDFNASPGQYDDGKRFGDNAKSFKIAEKRDVQIPQTAGPGDYVPETADSLTKTKAPRYDLGSSPSRPDNFTRSQDYNADPGALDDGKKFGDNAKSFRIGEKREARISQDVGPGEYSPEQADGQTRNRSALVDLSSSPERPDNFTRAQDYNADPGAYDDSKLFGEDGKSFTIGVKRGQEIAKTVGPGEYDLDRADKLTKTKSPNINMGKSESRPATLALKTGTSGAGPDRFNPSGTKGKKSATKSSAKPRTSELYKNIKPREPTQLMEPVKRNAGTVATAKRKTAITGAPLKQQATIDARRTSTLKTSKASTARKVPSSQTLQPRSSALGNPRSALKSTAAKGSSRAATRGTDSVAPGSYDIKGASFGEGGKSFRIGEKREQRAEQSPGPGEYSAERSDSVTKTRTVTQVEFSKQSGRKEPAREISPDFAQSERFYNYPKEVPIYTIGEKREEKMQESPGPGAYELDNSATKPRTTGGVPF